jgi:hypothetical protein
MPRLSQPDTFFLTIADWDRNVFTVEGPMTDDTPWTKAVRRLQATGRKVNTAIGHDRAQEMRVYEQGHGLRFVQPGSIVTPIGEDWQ